MPRAAKELVDIRSIARSHSETMIKVLVGVARAPDAPPSARVLAANSILDRGWGKADVVHAGPDGGPIQVIIRQLVDVIQHSDPLTIEHDDDCDK